MGRVSKIVDISCIMQVIGGVYLDPTKLSDNKTYHFTAEDFTEEFHRILFGSIYNLYAQGVTSITPEAIEKYLEDRPVQAAVFKRNNGIKYIENLTKITQIGTFDYCYNRMKKMTLLRAYQDLGMDMTNIYDMDNIMDAKKKQLQNDWLDNTPIEDIAQLIDDKIIEIRAKYVDNDESVVRQAGTGLLELIRRLKETPEVGIPLYGNKINAVTMGARLKKVYMFSAESGTGKTRHMAADACWFSCNEIYNIETDKWEQNGQSEPTLFITTEQEVEEIQTLFLAFVSGVNEEKILNGLYGPGELERVEKAAEIIEKAPLYIEPMSDFSLTDVENAIKHAIHSYGVRYVCHDYIHTSLKILSEVGGKSGIKGMREDNVLFMLGVKLKDIANKYGVFVETATQLSGDFGDAEVLNQSYLRGAKSLADKIDVGAIMIRLRPKDKEILRPICDKLGVDMPDIKMSIYKNRRSKYKDILLWCKTDLGTCRINPVFATNFAYELVDIQDLKINVEPAEENDINV